MNVINEPLDISFNKAGVTGKVFDINNLTDSAEFILIETKEGHTTEIIEHKSDFIYYILEGTGKFIINDISQQCSEGQLVIVPKGSKFTYKGNLKMFLICTPPWKEDQEEIIK